MGETTALQRLGQGREIDTDQVRSLTETLDRRTLSGEIMEVLLYGRRYVEYGWLNNERNPYNARGAPIMRIRRHLRGALVDTFGQNGFVYLTHDDLAVHPTRDPPRDIDQYVAQEAQRMLVATVESLHMLIGGLGLISPRVGAADLHLATYGDTTSIGFGGVFDPFIGGAISVPICIKTEGIQIGIDVQEIDLVNLESLVDGRFLERETATFDLFLQAAGESPTDYFRTASSSYHRLERDSTIHLGACYCADIALPGNIFGYVSFVSSEPADVLEEQMMRAYEDLHATRVPIGLATPDQLLRVRERTKKLSFPDQYAQRETSGPEGTVHGEIVPDAAPPFARYGNGFLYNITDPRVVPVLSLIIGDRFRSQAEHAMEQTTSSVYLPKKT